ncbi:MAG TPA: LysR family transcriptional regulator [Burkholderiaceae bacterium]|nr:LysR family transcriptional regulator [Burkholderiaceae bacterium]
MNLRFIEAFYWVATFKSVTRTAEKLFVTQSAVSSRIAALEEELGVLLIDRREKQFRLTSAGIRLLSYAEKFLALQRSLRHELGAGAGSAMTLRIGAVESVLHTWLIALIESLRREHPLLELDLTVETTPVLMEQMRRGALDLVFAAMPVQGDGIRNYALPPLEMVFVGRVRHGARRVWDLREIAEHGVLTFQRGSQPHAALMDQFKAAQIETRRVHSISSISAMVKLLECGFGMAMLPRPAAQVLVDANPEYSIVRCSTPPTPFPVHASSRTDPSSAALDSVVSQAIEFVYRFSGQERPAGRRRTVGGVRRQAARKAAKKAVKKIR